MASRSKERKGKVIFCTVPHLKKDKEATLLAAAAEEEKAREAKQAAQKEAEQQRKQVLYPLQAVSFVFSLSLKHCGLSRSPGPVCTHLVKKESIVSLMPCLGCPATAVSSCILCPAEKEADEQRKKDKEAIRLAAAAEEQKAREAKEAAQKEAEQQRKQGRRLAAPCQVKGTDLQVHGEAVGQVPGGGQDPASGVPGHLVFSPRVRRSPTSRAALVPCL